MLHKMSLTLLHFIQYSKKWSFPLRISLCNFTKYAGKLDFLCINTYSKLLKTLGQTSENWVLKCVAGVLKTNVYVIKHNKFSAFRKYLAGVIRKNRKLMANEYINKFDFVNIKQKQPPEVFCEKGVLRNFAKFTGKHLCQSLLLIKVQVSGLQFYWKRNSVTGVFLCILRNL